MTGQKYCICMKEEKLLYIKSGVRNRIKNALQETKRYQIWRALYSLRKLERLQAEDSQGFIHTIKVLYATRQVNRRSSKAGIEIRPGYTEKGLNIWHGGVVINGFVGENCIFHGNNVIGNKIAGSKELPHIGNRVEVGANAVIIGDVTIADDCVIGAGAVVTKSFTKPGAIIAGVPAKEIGKI